MAVHMNVYFLQSMKAEATPILSTMLMPEPGRMPMPSSYIINICSTNQYITLSIIKVPSGFLCTTTANYTPWYFLLPLSRCSTSNTKTLCSLFLKKTMSLMLHVRKLVKKNKYGEQNKDSNIVFKPPLGEAQPSPKAGRQ